MSWSEASARSDRLHAGLDEVAFLVLHQAELDVVLHRVDQLDVADAALRAFDLAGDAFVALLPDAGGPFDRGSDADLLSHSLLTLLRLIDPDIGVPLPSERWTDE